MNMCSMNTPGTAMLPFGMKLAGQSPYIPLGSSHLSLELQRAQLQDYTQRLQLGMRAYPSQVAGLNPLPYHNHLTNPYLHPYFFKDPRTRFIHEEPKPNHSYIGLIAMAILSSRDKKLVLSDIYQWILDNYSYFRTRGPGWRNSIRHNLSLNDCFIKAGRSANGKGHYWAIHPANIDDFQKGDFRRRRAQRRVRKHMGLSVPDDEDDDSPMPSPSSSQTQSTLSWTSDVSDELRDKGEHTETNDGNITTAINGEDSVNVGDLKTDIVKQPLAKRAKRMFDMESILAPDINEKSENPDVIDYKYETDLDESLDKDHNTETVATDTTDNSQKNDIELNKDKINVGEARDCNDGQSSPYTLESDTKVSMSSSPLSGSIVSPHLSSTVPGMRKPSDFRERVSAFRSASQYMWPSFGGYLSTYQLMTLGSNQMQQFLPSTNMSSESVERWRQTMANLTTQNQLKDETRALTVEDE